MDKIKRKIENDPDYVHIKRFNYSLKRLLERYPDGVPERIMCQALQLTPEEMELLYKSILEKLKASME